jgi:hydroxymethylpyrimidine/phosphomethylpyrimidine kinase
MNQSKSKISTPIALTIAGSDSGGGAGIQADLKAFSALGVYGASVITAITAQNTRAVTAVHGIPVDMVSAQIEAVFDDIQVDAVKIGMLSSPEIIQAVSSGLEKFEGPVVLDPVMVAKSGDQLLHDYAIQSLKDLLAPQSALLTPNLPEAGVLLGCPPAASEQEMLHQGRALLDLGAAAVLMKGGHAHGPDCIDLLIGRDKAPLRLISRRHNTRNTHGTGCTLSSSIAACFARGMELDDAVKTAHEYLRKAIIAADLLNVGGGHGPVHHFHEIW